MSCWNNCLRLSACLIVTCCIRKVYIANQPVMDVTQSSYKDVPVSIRSSNNLPAQENALSLFSMNVTNEDLDKMEVLCY